MGSMASPKDADNSDGKMKNPESKGGEKLKDSKKSQPPKKVFTKRNSVLTDLMDINHLQSVYNIMVAAFSLLLLNAFLYYLAAPEKFWSDVDIMRWSSSNGFFFIRMWILCHLFAFAILEGFKKWVHIRNKINSKIADTLFLFLYITSIALMFSVTPYLVLNNTVPPITAFSLCIEQVRIFMKIYSFVRESSPRVLQYKPSKDGDQFSNLYPTRKHYLYYLFAPVLIYRDSYPSETREAKVERVKEINWNFVSQSLFKFFACIFIAYCFFMRFIVDIFKHTALRPFTLPEASLIYAGATFVGATMMFLIFYCVLHSWLNLFAEITRFGDREFYQDWWNSTSFSQYYRKWNLVVYDWLYTYIYVETSNLGFSRSASMITVFLISALVHEYIISLALGFFYPVLMIIYSTIGVIVMFLTKQRTGQFWNTFIWSMLFAGWGLIVCLYSTEWFARANCSGSKDPIKDFFTPRSWDKSCSILTFSS